MIFYFSGTGNSRWAAEQIAALTGDETRDISRLEKTPEIRNEGQSGLVFPIYAWGVPEPMLDFVKTLEKTNAFTFGVCTCGEEAGLAMKKLSALYPLRSSYSLVMPNNYILGADVDDDQTARQKIHEAEKAIQQVCPQHQGFFHGGFLQRLRTLRPELSCRNHFPDERQARLGQAVLPVPALHP